jgi:hypothetical protein
MTIACSAKKTDGRCLLCQDNWWQLLTVSRQLITSAFGVKEHISGSMCLFFTFSVLKTFCSLDSHEDFFCVKAWTSMSTAYGKNRCLWQGISMPLVLELNSYDCVTSYSFNARGILCKLPTQPPTHSVFIWFIFFICCFHVYIMNWYYDFVTRGWLVVSLLWDTFKMAHMDLDENFEFKYGTLTYTCNARGNELTLWSLLSYTQMQQTLCPNLKIMNNENMKKLAKY